MSWLLFQLATTKYIMSLLLHCFPSPHVYLTHGPTFRNKCAFITEVIMSCQLSCHSRLHAGTQHNWELGVLVQNCLWWPNLPGGNVDALAQLTVGYWILFNCIYALLGSCKDAGSSTHIGLRPCLKWELGLDLWFRTQCFPNKRLVNIWVSPVVSHWLIYHNLLNRPLSFPAAKPTHQAQPHKPATTP